MSLFAFKITVWEQSTGMYGDLSTNKGNDGEFDDVFFVEFVEFDDFVEFLFRIIFSVLFRLLLVFSKKLSDFFNFLILIFEYFTGF